MAQTPESKLKMRIRKDLTSRGAFWSNIQGGAFSKPGDPDIVACYRGRYIAIEAKSPVGRQSDIQRTRQREIETAGGVYILARTPEDVTSLLDMMDPVMDYEMETERQEQGKGPCADRP